MEPFIGEKRAGQDFPMRNEDLIVNGNMKREGGFS